MKNTFSIEEYPGFEFDKQDNGDISVMAYCGKADSVEVPGYVEGHKVTTLGLGAFRSNLYVRQVVLPNTIQDISFLAFAHSEISDINLPAALKNIHTAAFYRCKNLL